MATITKHGARKLTDVGKPMIGYADFAAPFLLRNKHITIDIGKHVIRIEWPDAKALLADLQSVIAEHD